MMAHKEVEVFSNEESDHRILKRKINYYRQERSFSTTRLFISLTSSKTVML